MKLEAWSIQSRNRLATFGRPDEAFRWLSAVAASEGISALAGISLGDDEGTWAMDGQAIEAAVRGGWYPIPTVTAAEAPQVPRGAAFVSA
jgi:hypothetical protein